MMYYYISKVAERPVYSYRLSIVHFWALIFTYMWAGPHHLHYTALPDWAQSIGMIFSLVLLAPSWGGMINGIMTLSGAWHKLRDDPILKFLIVSQCEGSGLSFNLLILNKISTQVTLVAPNSLLRSTATMLTAKCT